MFSGASRRKDSGGKKKPSHPSPGRQPGYSPRQPPQPTSSPSALSQDVPPLQGIRILDLTRLYPGPLATMMLAEMGAEVLKVEDAIQPDYMRTFPPFVGDQSAGFLAVNRSKRSIAIKLNDERGQAIFFQLVKKADVVVEQFRPGVLHQLGIGYEDAIKSNPRIIYISLTGYGQQGPYAQKAGHDINYIGYSGLLHVTGSKEIGPVVPGAQIADIAGGAYMTVIACLSALWARERSGVGQRVDVSMLDGVLPLITLQLAHYWATGQNLPAWELPLSGGMACYGVYECADGKYVALGALEPKFWKSFCEVIGKPGWVEKLYVLGEEAQRMREELRDIFRTRTREEWLRIQGTRDMCLTPVLDISEVEQDPHLQVRGMFVEQEHPTAGTVKGVALPLHFSHTQPKSPTPAPLLGEHSIEILREVGYSDEEIAGFIRSGIVVAKK